MDNPKITELDVSAMQQHQSLPQRIATSVRYMISGITPDTWFSPSQPLQPVSQESKGRQWDYPVGYNLQIQTRPYEAVKFAQLRQLADGYDLMRLAIETVKDQIVKYKWVIKTTESTSKKPSREQQTRITEITDFLTYPDKVNNWDSWLRMLMEEMLVLDATIIYPRRTRGSGIYSLDVFSGDTIQPKIDEYGRRPEPPSVAYQQIIKGLPAIDFSADEIIYAMRNPRANRVYGLGPVEQIIVTVNIALRRQIVQLNHFTEGNIPEAIIGVPEVWTPDQIKELQTFWDSILSGNLAQRSKAKFVPSPMQIHDLRPNVLKDEFDEWLARIISYAFSLSPQALVREMNRATAETSRSLAIEEGQLPRMKWLKSVLDGIIHIYFGYRDLEFDWKIEERISAAERAIIHDTYVKNGVLSIDEVRDDIGKEALGMDNAIMTPMGPLFVKDLINRQSPPISRGTEPENAAGQTTVSSPPPTEAEKLEKARSIKPINRNRSSIVSIRNTLEKSLMDTFNKWKQSVKEIDIESFQKAEKTEEEIVDEILKNIKFIDTDKTYEELVEALSKSSTDGVDAAIIQIGLESAAIREPIVGYAVEYAKKRSAELVGKRFVDGKLIDNPRPKYAITDSTREFLRSDVTQALKEGWSNQKLADKIEENYGFSQDRSVMIARTETANADCQGNLLLYKESGLVMGKKWLTGSRHVEDDVCDLNKKAGIIPIDDDFPSGNATPPAHPRCVCSYVPVVKD